MIKRFEQYIRESLKLEPDFKFRDNFQAIIDSWEESNYIHMSNRNALDTVTFMINMPQEINKFINLLNTEVVEFLSELEIVLNSLEVDNISYILGIKGINSSIKIKITLFRNFSFAVLNNEFLKNGYSVEFSILEDSKWGVIAADGADGYDRVRLSIQIDFPESANHEVEIEKLLKSVEKEYRVVKAEYLEDDLYEYIVELEKK